MKTAVIITGFLRRNQPADKAFKQFAELPNTDFYLTCWDLMSTRAPGGLSMDIDEIVTEQHVRDRYPVNIKDINIVSYDDYLNNRPFVPVFQNRPMDILRDAPRARAHYDGGYAQRIPDMFYLNQLAADRVPMDEYDRIIKLRHDMSFTGPIPIDAMGDVLNIDDHQQVNSINSNSSYHGAKSVNLTHTDLAPYGLSYQLAWGKPAVMKPYMRTFDSIRKMYEEDNVDISAYEHTMSYYIQRVAKLPYKAHYVQHHYSFIRQS
jgi:hypothetical protein